MCPTSEWHSWDENPDSRGWVLSRTMCCLLCGQTGSGASHTLAEVMPEVSEGEATASCLQSGSPSLPAGTTITLARATPEPSVQHHGHQSHVASEPLTSGQSDEKLSF